MQAQDRNNEAILPMIWASLFSTLGLYAFVAFNVLELTGEAPADQDILLYALGGVAGMCGVMSFVLPKIIANSGQQGSFFVQSVIKFAMSEAVGAMGFGAVVLTNNPKIILYFLIPAATLFLIHNPFIQGSSRKSERRRLT